MYKIYACKTAVSDGNGSFLPSVRELKIKHIITNFIIKLYKVNLVKVKYGGDLLKENKSERIYLRVTSEEKELIIKSARSADMNISEYILCLVKKKRVVNIRGFPDLLYQIAKIGININQITAAINTKHSATIEELLNVQKLLNLVNERLNLILKQIDENTELSLSSSEKEIEERLKKLESDFENLKGKNNGNS